MSCAGMVLNRIRATAARTRAATVRTTARPRRWVRTVVAMVVIVWLLIRCGSADETNRAARTTHGQSPRRQDTCHPHDSPTGAGISRPRVSPRSRPGAKTRSTPPGRNAGALVSRFLGPIPLRVPTLTDIIDRLGVHD